jgi:ATPase subunit of ABC transporter with duplicated ATPase domains
MPWLTFDKITKRFPGVTALDGVTFGVERGACHALIGENGAGKSTLGKDSLGRANRDPSHQSHQGEFRNLKNCGYMISAARRLVAKWNASRCEASRAFSARESCEARESRLDLVVRSIPAKFARWRFCQPITSESGSTSVWCSMVFR